MLITCYKSVTYKNLYMYMLINFYKSSTYNNLYLYMLIKDLIKNRPKK